MFENLTSASLEVDPRVGVPLMKQNVPLPHSSLRPNIPDCRSSTYTNSVVTDLLQCTKDTPDVASLFQFFCKSLDCVKPWTQAYPWWVLSFSACLHTEVRRSSGHPFIASVVTDVRCLADKFVKTLEIFTASTSKGLSLASDMIVLCDSLNVHDDAEIVSFIEELRLQAWHVYNDALCRSEMLSSILRELLEVCIMDLFRGKQL